MIVKRGKHTRDISDRELGLSDIAEYNVCGTSGEHVSRVCGM
jgi:hypothetical protein